jgi:hypothetical protein
MLATWLVEIYLSKLGELDNLISSAHSTSCNSNSNQDTATAVIIDNGATNNNASDLLHYQEQQEDIVDEFKTFIESYNAHLHRPTTFSLLSRHGRNDILLFYASLNGDYNQVINYWIMEKNWKKALEVISKQVKRGRDQGDKRAHSFSVEQHRHVLSLLTCPYGKRTL